MYFNWWLLLQRYSQLALGKMSLAHHHINMEPGKSNTSRALTKPNKLRGAIERELRTMLELGNRGASRVTGGVLLCWF